MKHGCKPTHQQRKALELNELDTHKYLVVKSVKSGWLFQHRDDNSVVVCFPDKKGLYTEDGVTLIE